jgi:hypothetical protein
MVQIKRWLRAALGILRLAGLAAGALAVIFGLFQDISGGTSFWSLTPQNWITIGVVLIALLARPHFCAMNICFTRLPSCGAMSMRKNS